MPDPRLYAEVVAARQVPTAQVEQLYALYATHYDGGHPERFRADLAEKEWVILLRDPETAAVVGFSTQKLLESHVGEEHAAILFSGDTIIHRDYWGSQALVRAWCRFAGELKARCGDRPLYWFLISKGYRTYLYLPLFFHEFHPRYGRPIPPREAELLVRLGTGRYGPAFDPATGLIEHPGAHDRLKPELDGTASRRGNPHVDYFVRRNPRYREGVELACIAEIRPENMRGAARRELETGLRGTPGGAAG
jgi:hypothetical protein